MPTKRQRTPNGRVSTTPVTDEPSSSSSSSSSPACGTSNNPTSPGMTANMRDRQTVVLFGKPGLRPHSFGRVRGGKGCRCPVKEIQQRLSKESAGGCGVRIPDEQVLSRVWERAAASEWRRQDQLLRNKEGK